MNTTLRLAILKVALGLVAGVLAVYAPHVLAPIVPIFTALVYTLGGANVAQAVAGAFTQGQGQGSSQGSSSSSSNGQTAPATPAAPAAPAKGGS